MKTLNQAIAKAKRLAKQSDSEMYIFADPYENDSGEYDCGTEYDCETFYAGQEPIYVVFPDGEVAA